ncbi:MAG: serine/threonine protein kinase [Planctomycetota bacterium]|jgi:serine/threonine protein kinase|nr:serine/threonine protein kinase [Planctomycetota bacterium]
MPALANPHPVLAEEKTLTPFATALKAEQPFRGYELSVCLASEEHSAVFRAHDQTLGKMAVVKALRPWPDRPGAVEEFFSLAGSTARVRQPQLARGLDVGRGQIGLAGNDRGESVFFMVYAPAEGRNLSDYLAKRHNGRLRETEALRLVEDIASILQRLFESGQSFRDLSPGRILLGRNNRVTLVGFGFAWNLAWPEDQLAYLARPHYLAPERIAGEINLDIRSDLYALGCLWHQLLLGCPVFDAVSPQLILKSHREDLPTSPRERDPKISAATSGLLLRLLAKNRQERPRTPKEFLQQLYEHPLRENKAVDPDVLSQPEMAEGETTFA